MNAGGGSRGGLDRIIVTGIRASGRHGVLPVEATRPQAFVIDVVIHCDTRAAAAEDHLSATVDYATVAALAERRVVGPRMALIESLAEAIAKDVLRLPGVELVDVCVHKPHAPLAQEVADVAVAIRRPR